MKLSTYNTVVTVDGRDFIYNGRSGGLIDLGRGGAKKLQGPLDEVEPDLLTDLVRGQMVLPDQTDEISLLRAKYQSGRVDRTSLHLTLVTSLGCNFDCPYCFEAKRPSIMSSEVADAVARLVESRIANLRRLDVTWYGGEPLLGKRLLASLSARLQQICVASGTEYGAAIITNGYLLDRDTALMLAEHAVTEVQVTMDGPPAVHDIMRPLLNGAGTFGRIVENLKSTCDILHISVRVNIDKRNASQVEKLMQILCSEGLSGKIGLYPAQIVPSEYGAGEPSATYKSPCFGSADYARYALEFSQLATSYGFGGPSLPEPTTVPCTAIAGADLVVGSEGELYKCWESVGNPEEVIGSILEPDHQNSRAMKWAMYDPFEDSECRSCVALPVCMGGCAAHALVSGQYENRCGTFRHTHEAQVARFVQSRLGRGISEQPSIAVHLAAPARRARKVGSDAAER